MFTGIIEELGTIRHVDFKNRSARLSIEGRKVLSDLQAGDSIAVNGVCLTVVSYDREHFEADVMPETLDRSSLKSIRAGTRVNLERALRMGDRMGGHLVQGHVDGTGILAEKSTLDIAILYRMLAPAQLLHYTVPKGSVAIDGISLTVIDVLNDSFTVSLIPHTATMTTLGFKKPGDTVNLETDIVGRYVERFCRTPAGDAPRALNLKFLAENGFA